VSAASLEPLGRVIPVVVIDDAARAAEVASALSAGGIRCAEITLRTEAGLAAIAAIAALDLAGFTVGAGTVLTLDDLERCVDAGARFIVSPGFDEQLVERANHLGVGVLPGVATATEVQRAAKAGVGTVKFFPADRLGGLDTIAAPFRNTRFVPSGGVTAQNGLDYLRHPAVPAISGSWMVTRQLIAAGDLEAIERLSADFTSRLETPA